MKVLIEVQCYNRKIITEKCLKHLNMYKKNAYLQVINDYSTEYDNQWLLQYADNVIQYEEKLNINRLKYRTFKNFLNSNYDFLYMTDNDAIHDPDFMNQLFKMYYQSNCLPVTLYRSSFIKKCKVYNIVKLIPNGEIRKGLFGGISTFLSRSHIENIVKNLPSTENEWDYNTQYEAWDSKIQRWASNSFFAIPQNSYVEHFGIDGQNHKLFESDQGLDLSPYLYNIKNIIINELTK